MNKLDELYFNLLNKYGYQGWWPIIKSNNSKVYESKLISFYHPKDYTYPKTESQKFEICIGAILTQNTSWTNVEKSLKNLYEKKLIDPKKILESSDGDLINCIKPSGYFNQKTRKLKIFSEFFIKIKNRTPSREELLSLWGVGPETADSILLYAYIVPEFIVDSYTKKFLLRNNILIRGKISTDLDYNTIKEFFENNLEKDYKMFQEFHALIVEDGKINSKIKL